MKRRYIPMAHKKRKARVIVTAINLNQTATRGKYANKPLTVVVFQEIDKDKNVLKKGIKASLRNEEPQNTKRWMDIVELGNIIETDIGTNDDGVDYIDRKAAAKLIERKSDNVDKGIQSPVRQQVPAKSYDKVDEAGDLIMGMAINELEQAAQTVRQTIQDLKRAEQDIEKAISKLKDEK
jgi:hypothetical protein